MYRAILIIASALLYAASLAPWYHSWVAWFALVPFLHALRGLRPLRAGFAGLAWGTIAIWAIGHWVPTALSLYYGQPPWFGMVFAFGASIIFAGSYYAGFAACVAWIGDAVAGWKRDVLIACLWVCWELARARLLTGDPWLLFGYALVPDTLLIQIADLGGVYLLSFVLALVNVSLLGAIQSFLQTRTLPVRELGIAGAVVVAVCVYGTWRLSTPLADAPKVQVRLVQGNNDLGSQWRADLYGQGLQDYLRLSAAAGEAEPQLLIWPESAITFFLAHEAPYRAVIQKMLAEKGVELIVGGPHFDGADPAQPYYFNSAFLMDSEGIRARYDKVHLLPFGEYFPLRMIEFLRRQFERVRSFTPGDQVRTLPTKYGEVASVICFEGIFPELVRTHMNRGAGLLVNLSNDAWAGPGSGPEQHFSMTVLRSVENRVWMVRATTTGVSAVVDPFGRIVARAPSAEATTLDHAVVPMQVDTVYSRFGDVFAQLCVAISALGLLARARVGWRDA